MKKYAFQIISFLLLVSISGSAQLTGEWVDENGTCYMVRQVGDEVYWSMDGRPVAVNVFKGLLVGNIINGKWADVPGGDKIGNGTLSLRVESNDRMIKIGQRGDYGASTWTRQACSNIRSSESSFLSASPGNNNFLNRNEFLVSPSGKYFLHMQEDGNLVLYRGSGPDDRHEPIWNSKTYSTPNKDSFLAIQDDGNLVVYRGSPGNYQTPAWNSKTFREKGKYFLAVQDDGKIIIAKGTGPNDNQGIIWTKP